MKQHLMFAILLACGAGVCFGDEVILDIREIKQPAVDALAERKGSILARERLVAEAEYGQDKAETYMEYFEKGMDSKGGIILIEGAQSRWLELAFWRGHAFREAFLAGYLSGTSATGLPDPKGER